MGYRAWGLLVGLAACRPGGAGTQANGSAEAARAPATEGAAGAGSAEAAPNAQLVEYAPDRRGFFYLPAGQGPFPVMVWNHGSERKPGSRPELARFYLAHGWAFFVPHRRGQGRSPGEYIGDEVDDAKVLAMQEAHNDDVVSAIAWAKQQPEIDSARVVVSGCSYGGIQTLITAARPVDIRAAIAFAPGAMRWRVSPGLRSRLVQAAHDARVPTLLIQADNDYDLSPSQVVGAELERSGHGRAKVYPSTGGGAQRGHGFCVTGSDVWGPDVFAFIDDAMK